MSKMKPGDLVQPVYPRDGHINEDEYLIGSPAVLVVTTGFLWWKMGIIQDAFGYLSSWPMKWLRKYESDG